MPQLVSGRFQNSRQGRAFLAERNVVGRAMFELLWLALLCALIHGLGAEGASNCVLEVAAVLKG